MKKIWILVLLIIIIASAYYYGFQGDDLQSQVLPSSSQVEEITDGDDCLKMSENAANECLLRLALEEKKDNLCSKISKASKKRECVREVEITK